MHMHAWGMGSTIPYCTDIVSFVTDLLTVHACIRTMTRVKGSAKMGMTWTMVAAKSTTKEMRRARTEETACLQL